MKKTVLFTIALIVGVLVFGKETTTEVAKESIFNWGNILTVGLGIAALVAGAFLSLIKSKLKQAIELLSAFSNAIEDNKINANERKDLVERFKLLFKKGK